MTVPAGDLQQPIPCPNRSEVLPRALGLVTASALVIGSVVGSGIFVKPGIIAHHVGDFRVILSLWVAGGVLALFGSLCFAELGAMLPRAGGLYVYLREAYGPLVAFLLGWCELLLYRPGSTGALSIILVRSLASMCGWSTTNLEEVGLAIGIIVAVAAVNVRGVLWGGALQVGTTVIKTGFLVLLISLPVVLLPFGGSDFSFANWGTVASTAPQGTTATALGSALLAIMWAYNGWHGVNQVAEEIRHPERSIPLALLGGTVVVMALYLGANLVFHGVLPVEGVVQSGERVAEDVLFLLLGSAGLIAMNAVLACSVLGALNSDLLLGSRIVFAMGRDGLFFRSLGRVHPVYRTPAVAILVQSAMAVTLVLASGLLVEFHDDLKQQSVFDLLTNFVIFAVSIFYALAVASVIVLRWKHPDWPRPYRTWGYPFVPLAFTVAYAWFLNEVYWAQPVEARSGLVFLALGIPAYFAMRAFNRRQAPARASA